MALRVLLATRLLNCALIWLCLPCLLCCCWGVAVVCEVRGDGIVIVMGGMVVVVMVSVGVQLPENYTVKSAVCSVCEGCSMCWI